MEFDTEPVEHILSHLVRGKSSEPLVAFDVCNKGDHCYDNRLLLVTPGTVLSLDLDRDQAKDLISVLRTAYELDGVENHGWNCTYRCYELPSHSMKTAPSKSRKRNKRKANTAG